jgi:cytochrome P450
MRLPTTYGHYNQVPPEGNTINGIFSPGGTAIGDDSIAMLPSEAIFDEDVDIFRPERFLECSDDKRLKMERMIDLVFGTGRWLCAGKSVVWMEMNKVHFKVNTGIPLGPV